MGPSISGTEAVEAGVKLAREATGRPMILSFYGQYHGESTYLTASVSSDLSEVTSNNAQYVVRHRLRTVPQPLPGAIPQRPRTLSTTTIYVDFIEEWVLVHQVDPEQIAGVLIEPVLGEGGILIPSAAFWERLTALCKRFGWMLVLDEVQTCLGRCGTMFAAELWGLEPDVVLMGQGLAGGAQPIAAVLATERVMADCDTHPGGTFAWTPPACAGARRTSTRSRDRRRARQRQPGLARIASDELGDLPIALRAGRRRARDRRVAGRRVRDRQGDDHPAPAFHAAVHRALVRRGVLGITQWGKWVYRLQPAINMPPELFRWSCRAIADAIDEVAKRPPEEPALLIEREPPVQGGSRRR